MSESKIPDAIRSAAVDALYDARNNGKVMDEAAEAVVRVVDPMSRVAELWRLIEAFERRADAVPLFRDGHGTERRATLLDCADAIRARIEELEA